MDRHQYSNGHPRGFTIMEVLVAAFILVVGLATVAAFIGNAIGSTARSEYMNQAATLASEKLEDLNRSPAKYNVNTGLDSGDPHVIVTNGVSAGSLTADVVQNVTANGTPEARELLRLGVFLAIAGFSRRNRQQPGPSREPPVHHDHSPGDRHAARSASTPDLDLAECGWGHWLQAPLDHRIQSLRSGIAGHGRSPHHRRSGFAECSRAAGGAISNEHCAPMNNSQSQLCRKTRMNGFTLLELLVAMTMFLVVPSATFSLFRTHAPYFNAQQNLAGLNISLQNAVTQMQIDLSNAGTGFYANTNVPGWPVGVVINNQLPATPCNIPATYTYTATCFDTLNVLTMNPNIAPAHPTDAAAMRMAAVTQRPPLFIFNRTPRSVPRPWRRLPRARPHRSVPAIR